MGGVEADVVLELTPSNINSGEPGLGHMLKALKAGCHVVTSNKAPLALKYGQVMKAAKKAGKTVKFEATVGGGIPIINLREGSLKANEITNIYGVLNGTTNFILSKMSEEGVSLEVALKEAQELGYAETDPSQDVSGLDTAAKVAILANALMNKNVSIKDVKVSGIGEITSDTVELALKHGHAVKLIGDVRSLEVSPRLIPLKHPLNVSGSLNAIMLESDVSGPITLIGAGAGARETSSSLLSDLLEVGGTL
jgi:homoserine dehydrogenase